MAIMFSTEARLAMAKTIEGWRIHDADTLRECGEFRTVAIEGGNRVVVRFAIKASAPRVLLVADGMRPQRLDLAVRAGTIASFILDADRGIYADNGAHADDDD